MQPAADHRDIAAEQSGIVPGYWDIEGNWRETTPSVRDAIRAAAGPAPARTDPPPGYVLSPSMQPWTIVMPARGADGYRLDLLLEDGSLRRLEFGPNELAVDERGLRVPLPADLPLGYHRARWTADPAAEGTHVVICPDRAWLPPALENGGRRAGLAVSLYGVHSRRTWGTGDFTALRELIDWVVEETGGSYIALNPLHAIHNRQPYNISPYLPNSSFYRNLIYLDIDAIADMEGSAEAQALRAAPATLAEIEALNRSEFVEYERVQTLKLRLLEVLFAQFREHELAHGTARGLDFEAYAEREGDLLNDYALYMALDAHLHREYPHMWIWPDWPEPYRRPDSAEVRQFRRQHAVSILFHKYIQWQLDVQARQAQEYALERGMEIGLFHDLPLATDKCGSELWAHRRFFVEGCRVGSPPDAFAPKGQDWSFPPPNREAHRADGYRLFGETIRMSARHGGALRIDHVMRLFRLYWIPDGMEATEGTYVRDYPEDLLRVVALESVRNQVLIVGEDLGTVEPEQREALARFGILSYRLFYFEKNAGGSFKRPDEYPRQALVSSTTHDLATLAGFWAGADIEARHRLGLIGDEAAYESWRAGRRDEKRRMLEALIGAGLLADDFPPSAADGPELAGEIHNAITGFLASTPAMLMTLNQEDLTKELDQQNMPGTTWQYPNWRRKMKFSIEDLREMELAHSFAAMLRHWVDREGRGRAASGGGSPERG